MLSVEPQRAIALNSPSKDKQYVAVPPNKPFQPIKLLINS